MTKKRPRESLIEQGHQIGKALTAGLVAQFATMEDVDLAIYIKGAEDLLAAAKQEQTRRLSKVFLPPA